ncbi:2946_t:CDS:1 [Acaulospora colombiana]|uniref:2946_t:CDS:1 n=1 Tax=Acaulospora colombiana TaxID=27376 RepID=A0ACA9KRU2_9GLOM|nr:2946_t:CDS:1 [Acaulospora colombiana]
MSGSYDLQSNYRPSFPPLITANDIVNIHMEKGLDNANKTLNAFLIYRVAYSREIAGQSVGNISKMASNSWKKETDHVKDFYKKMASEVKAIFKRKAPVCFVKFQDLPVVSSQYPPSSTDTFDERFLLDVPEEIFIKLIPDSLVPVYMDIGNLVDQTIGG